MSDRARGVSDSKRRRAVAHVGRRGGRGRCSHLRRMVGRHPRAGMAGIAAAAVTDTVCRRVDAEPAGTAERSAAALRAKAAEDASSPRATPGTGCKPSLHLPTLRKVKSPTRQGRCHVRGAKPPRPPAHDQIELTGLRLLSRSAKQRSHTWLRRVD